MSRLRSHVLRGDKSMEKEGTNTEGKDPVGDLFRVKGSGEDPKPEKKPASSSRPRLTEKDAKQEGEDVVEMLDGMQRAISPKLEFNAKDSAYHQRTVAAYAKHYGVHPSEYVLHVRGAFSIIKILWHWGSAAWDYFTSPPPTSPVPPEKQA